MGVFTFTRFTILSPNLIQMTKIDYIISSFIGSARFSLSHLNFCCKEIKDQLVLKNNQ